MIARWSLVLALAGCDQVFSLDRPPLEPDAPAVDSPDPDGPRTCMLGAGVSRYVAPMVTAIAAGDVTDDDLIDLVVASTGNDWVSVLHGDGQGGFGVQDNIDSGGATPRGLVVADFDQDDLNDIAVANAGSGSVMLLFARPPGFTGTRLDSPNTPVQLAAGRIDGDQTLDLAVTHDSSGAIDVFLTGTSSSVQLSNPGGPRAVAIANVDASNGNDVIGATNNGDARVFLGNGTGAFAVNPPPFQVGLYATAVVAQRLDDDPHVDLAFATQMDDRVTVFSGLGMGSLGIGLGYSVGADPIALVAADVIGDSSIDLVTANAGSASLSILTGSSTGDFLQAIELPSGNTPTGLVAADFNGDGRLDLAVANGVSGMVTVLLSTCTP